MSFEILGSRAKDRRRVPCQTEDLIATMTQDAPNDPRIVIMIDVPVLAARKGRLTDSTAIALRCKEHHEVLRRKAVGSFDVAFPGSLFICWLPVQLSGSCPLALATAPVQSCLSFGTAIECFRWKGLVTCGACLREHQLSRGRIGHTEQLQCLVVPWTLQASQGFLMP